MVLYCKHWKQRKVEWAFGSSRLPERLKSLEVKERSRRGAVTRSKTLKHSKQTTPKLPNKPIKKTPPIQMSKGYIREDKTSVITGELQISKEYTLV